MAISILQQPGNVSFAGNPIIVKAHTSLTGKTFLRIVARVSATAASVPATLNHYTEEYTYNVSGLGYATFNISETLRAAVEGFSEVGVKNGTVVQKICRARYYVELTEVYLDGMVEIKGDTAKIGPFIAAIGGLSDYELSLRGDFDMGMYIGSGLVLSRKPDGEVLYSKHPLYIPVMPSATASASISRSSYPPLPDEVASVESVSAEAYIPVSVCMDMNGVPEGAYTFTVTPCKRPYTTVKYVRPDPIGKVCSFLFLNGFNVLESITAHTGRAKDYHVSQEHFLEVGPMENAFSDSINMGTAVRGELRVTSGYVSQEWADWWITEFLTSRKVWMLFGSRYLPVTVEADERMTVYDTSRPGMCAVQFTVRCAFGGSTVSTVR